MPNWCSNYIVISGEEKNMKPLVEFFSKPQETVMQSLVPFDPEDQALKEGPQWVLGDFSTFYGTKQDFGSNSPDVYPDYIVLNIETAWAPCNEFLRRLCKKYNVNVSNEYEESGCDFAGRYTCDEEGNDHDEEYSWMEGIYKIDNELFWIRMDDETFEWIESVEDLQEEFEFLDSDDMKTLIEIYNTNKGE